MKSNTHPRSLLLAVCVLFFISGATGLVYQVVWTRFFTVVFGNTTLGVSAVLTGFMAGLGLGSYMLGRSVDRRRDFLMIYAILEVGIAVTAVLMPWLLDWLQDFYSSIYNAFPNSTWLLQVIRTLISFCILVVPTFLMGATLPVLAKFFVSRTNRIGASIGVLYGANTLGATFGAFIAGFFLIKIFGLLHTVYLTAFFNILLAIAFLLLRQLLGKGADYAEAARESVVATRPHLALSPGRVRLLLASFAIAGFASLSYEILWFRLLVFELQTTIYAFTAMLTTFLAGIGLGSAAMSGWFKKTRTAPHYWGMFGYVEAAIGLLGLLSIWLFGSLEYIGMEPAKTFWGNIGNQFQIAAIIMLLPTLLMGAAFPIVCKILSDDAAQVGGTVGKVYAANTLGSIFGSFLTGFFLVRYLGTQNTIILVSMLNLLVASVILLFAPRSDTQAAPEMGAAGQTGPRFRPANMGAVAAIWISGVAGVLVIPSDYLFQYYNIGEKRYDSNVEILHAEEGLETITTVHRYPNGSRVISTGSINVAGTSYTLRTTQMLQGHIPMLLRPDAKHVLQVGFGSGETAHIITTYDNVERLDLVDISQSVLDSSAMYFRDINRDVVQDPKFHPTIMDGANYLRLTKKKYDVIMNDSIWPFYAGNSGLYTRDYFLAGKQHLNKGGIMTSWLPVEIAPEDFEILINSFKSAFPYVSVWMAMTHYNKHALLIGSEEPISINTDKFLERFDKYAREDLKLVDLDNPINLLDSFKMDEKGFAKAVADGGIHTENDPVLEFSYSRGKPAGNEYRVYQFMVEHAGSVVPYLTNIPGDDAQQAEFRAKVAAAGEASAHVMKGFIKRQSYVENYQMEFDEALRIWPEHPGAQSMTTKVGRVPVITREMLEGKSYEDLGMLGQSMLMEQPTASTAMVLERMLELRPDDASVRRLLGRIYLKLERFEDAISALKAAQLQAPDEKISDDLAVAYRAAGVNYAKRGDTVKANEYLLESIRLSPTNSDAYTDYGVLLGGMGKVDEAASKFEEAIRLSEKNADAHNNLGLLLVRQGKHDAALEHFKKAVEIKPDNLAFREHLTYAYFYTKRYTESWAEVRQIRSAGGSVNPQFINALRSAMPEPQKADVILD